MRSLGVHPRSKQDPHDTMQALRDFHATTLAWAYITDRDFIARVKASGRVFGGAASAPSYIPADTEKDWFEEVVIVDLEGKPIIAPWKRTWKRTLWGCVNNPQLQRGYIEYLKRYIDAGAQVMQRDEPGANFNATHWGGCFCDHCMAAFRRYLAANTTAEQRRRLGIGNPETFDYRQYLRAAGAPVGDPFGRWNGGELKELFIEFQTKATIEFHRRTRKAIDQYAGRHVPFSCNNGVRRWGEIELCFDWAFGELAYRDATAHSLYRAMRQATAHNRLQVVTMPKKSNYDDLEQWERRTRQTIAMAYACGGHCMVPWDVYMPRDAPRYFGKPEQYADLFGFIRAASRYFDGYEQAVATGYGVPKQDENENTPPGVRIVGDQRVFAMVRAVPEDGNAPVVIHLVDWSEHPHRFALQVDPARFFGDRPLEIRLLLPKPYVESEHRAAEQSGDFRPLCRTVLLATGRVASVDIPALDPWGIVVVEPSKANRHSVWQPAIWAEESSYYSERLIVRIDCASPDAEVRYTIDGTEPDRNSPRYAGPFPLTGSATIRAVAFTGTDTGPVAAATFTKIEGTAAPLRPDAAAPAGALKLWLTADTLAGSLSDGDLVQKWPATVGPDALVPPGKLRSGASPAAPTFVAAAIDGKPAIRFDGVDDLLAIRGFANRYLAGKGFTILMVTQSSSPSFGICGNGLTGSGGIPRLYLTRNTFRYNVLDKGLALHVPDRQSAVSTFTHDGRETIAAYVNGKLQGRQSALPPVSAFGGGNLAMPFWSGDKNYPGDIAEVIAFDRCLTDEQRRGVEAYLAEKYRIRYERKWR